MLPPENTWSSSTPAYSHLAHQPADSRDNQIVLAIASTFTAEPIAESLNFWADLLQLPAIPEFAPYNQVFQALLDPASLFAHNRTGVNIALLRLEDWSRRDQQQADQAQVDGQPAATIERNVHDFIEAARLAAGRTSVPYIICVCPASPAALADSRTAACLAQCEAQIKAELHANNQITVISSAELTQRYPVDDAYDAQSDELGHIPYSPAGFAAIGTMLARTLYALRRPVYKVIALDCDNTLWQGVCGEDGPQGVAVSSAYRSFQQALAAQSDAGMLLCLCSKNNAADVWAVFDQRADMPLTRDHLVASQLNWQSKSENLRALAAELNLSLDSFIFIDDNPVECAEVQAHCPEALTLQLPTAPDSLTDFVNHSWVFDLLKRTAEDQQRTAFYRQERAREQVRAAGLTFEAFLAELALEVRLRRCAPEDLARAAQLTQRTNQFNLTTIRRAASDLEQLSASGAYESWIVEVRDRFGDYGVTGLVIFSTADRTLAVDTWLLSCRVLGRGVEHRVLAWLGEMAQARGLERIELAYRPTPKNQPARDFLERVVSNFRETDAAATRYLVPAAQARRITPAAAQEPAAPVADTPANHAVAPPVERADRIAAASTLRRIAAELTTADQILRAIEARRRRTRSTLHGVFEAPRTPIEAQLSAIWADLIGLDRVGVSDNFFAIGGNSLLGTRLVARVRDTFQIDLPLISLFEAPTIAGIASVIERHQLAHVADEDLAEWLQELDSLSDDEIKALLSETDSSTSL